MWPYCSQQAYSWLLTKLGWDFLTTQIVACGEEAETIKHKLCECHTFARQRIKEFAQKGLKRPACIPYISEYSDCSEYTTCRGCTQCRCNSEGQWICYKKRQTCTDHADDMEIYDDGTEDNAVGKILQELADKEREERSKKRPTHLAPLPEKRKKPKEESPLGMVNDDVMKELHELMRGRRSLGEKNETHEKIKFHHTVDEIDTDTLKNSNISGTLGVQKVDLIPSGSHRRAGLLVNSTDDPLHIEYNHPPIYNNHITDDKIDSSRKADKYDDVVNDKLHSIINYTEEFRDKELSKLVVNELKNGSETIGDSKAPVMSNITFTPEKDTLTAMAFIAGNLLNKLWNLERDVSDDSIETNRMKNQKIADLLDLFKEPLTYRQELFLKDALEQLSGVVHKNKENENFSLCEFVDDFKKDLISGKLDDFKEEKKGQQNEQGAAAVNALFKLNEVLDLMTKYQSVQKNLHDIKHEKKLEHLNEKVPALRATKEDGSLNVFGNILEKVTNLLSPNKNTRAKNKIRNQNIFRTSHDLDDTLKKMFDINLDTMKLTSKDKFVLDYISRMQSNPCLTSNLQEDKSIRYRESDILLNLSEFFRIKSYADLLKLVEPKSKIAESTALPSTASTSTPSTTVQEDLILRSPNNNSITEIENSTLKVNEKLKVHLKAIVNDLIEIQNGRGKEIKLGEINITDVLPCILKMLNQEKNQPKAVTQYSPSALLNKIKRVLETVRNKTRDMPPTRRNYLKTGPRPKSAVVWERLVRNLDRNPKPSRRLFKVDEPETYETVKKMIDHMEANGSNMYKTNVLYKNVPASEKLVVLKTLSLDTGNSAKILEKLLTLNYKKKLPENELEDLIEFVDNVASNFELNAKIMKTLDKTQEKKNNLFADYNKSSIKGTISGTNPNLNDDNNFKMIKEKALNELIKNRVKQYIKDKEAESATEDAGYDIAQRILSNFEKGSDKLAQELYKVLIETSQRDKNRSASKVSKPKLVLRANPLADKRPLTRVGDATNRQWVTEDLFLKTLESAWENMRTI